MKVAAKDASRNRFVLRTGIAAFLLSAGSVCAKTPDADGIVLKRFAFLPQFFLDLGRQSEHRNGDGRAYKLADCSNDEFNCLKGNAVRVAWPKNCLNMYDGAVWTTPLVTTEVVGTFVRPGHHVDTTYFVAKSSGVSNALYIFRRELGLVGVIHDSRLRGTLADPEQLPGILAELPMRQSLAREGISTSYLAGFGKVGICRSPVEVKPK